MVKKNVTTVELNGLVKVQFDKEYNYFFVNNLSGGDVLMSTDLIVEGADGVITVPDGASYGTMHGYATDTLYVKGSGKVQVMGTDSAFNPFKAAVKGGEIKTAVGTNISVKNSVEFPLLGLNVYGKSWQDGSPSADNAVPIESIGDSGSLTVTSQDGTAINIADAGIEGYGIPVDSDGNYIDSNGQQWVCDELVVNADGTGKIIKSCRKFDCKSNDRWLESSKLTGRYVHEHYCLANVTPICPYFKGKAHDPDKASIEPNIVFNNQGVQLCFNTKFSSLDEWLAFLDTVDLYVYEALATTEETELTSEQLTALQPLIDKYGAFTAYFMSTQDGIPAPENPVEIVSAADLHRTKTATIATELPLRGIPVLNNGNYTDGNGQQWVCDMLIYGSVNSKIVKYIDTETFDGSTDERWGLSGSNKRINSDKLSQLAKPSTSSSAVMPCLCDRLTARSGAETYNGIEGIAFDASANVCIAFSELAGNSDISAWKDYLAANPVTVVYQLANPTEVELTEEETKALLSLRTFEGTTNIYNSENADMSVKYLTSKAISEAVMPVIKVLGG